MKRNAKKTTRRLQLNKTTLRNLQDAELAGAAGGAAFISFKNGSMICSISSDKVGCGDACYHQL